VLYSHRALVLNALSICLPSVSSISPHDTLMPVVPMFHVNAWCIPYATPIVGARLVLPGPKLDGASLYELIETAGVTVSAAVPTIWQALALHVEQHDLRFTTLRRAWIGGAAMPASLIKKFEEHYGVGVCHGWGMTETASTSTMGSLLPRHVTLPGPERHAVLAQQGFSLFGVELKVVDAHGATLPRDGVSQGELYIRGQWVLSRYFKSDASALVDGWFPTGDIATLDAHGVMQIRDRAKDVIKTGGEWISSIDLENTALSHPAVALAAVIGVRHPKWDERPLLFVVRKAGAALTRDEILAYLGERVVKWWVPDDVVFVESLPVGGTGKVQKGELRKQYDGVFS
jgi:fatty-acyl-CoA synthase